MTGGIVVARDVKAVQCRGQIESGEMVGRKPGNDRQQRQHRFERQHGLDAFAGGENVGSVAKAHAVAEQIAKRAAGIGQVALWPDFGGRARCAGCR